VLGQSVLLNSSLALEELRDLVRRAAAYGSIRRVPDPLRAEDVDTITVSVISGDAFTIVPDGLYDGWRPGISVEGRGEIVHGADGTCIQFEVGPDSASLVSLWVGPAMILAFAVGNVLF